jgi:hypothetical protein
MDSVQGRCRNPASCGTGKQAFPGAIDALLPLSFGLPTAAMPRRLPLGYGMWQASRGQEETAERFLHTGHSAAPRSRLPADLRRYALITTPSRRVPETRVAAP